MCLVANAATFCWSTFQTTRVIVNSVNLNPFATTDAAAKKNYIAIDIF